MPTCTVRMGRYLNETNSPTIILNYTILHCIIWTPQVEIANTHTRTHTHIWIYSDGNNSHRIRNGRIHARRVSSATIFTAFLLNENTQTRRSATLAKRADQTSHHRQHHLGLCGSAALWTSAAAATRSSTPFTLICDYKRTLGRERAHIQTHLLCPRARLFGSRWLLGLGECARPCAPSHNSHAAVCDRGAASASIDISRLR